MEIRLRHKKEGWTGTLNLTDSWVESTFWASHRMGFNIKGLTLVQDAQDENGKYHEDPSFSSLEEFEILEKYPPQV